VPAYEKYPLLKIVKTGATPPEASKRHIFSLPNQRGEGVDSQGKFSYAMCDEVELPACPHCGSVDLYAHGYYHRNASAVGRDYARKRLRIINLAAINQMPFCKSFTRERETA